jgi:hypothetical protein
MNSVSDAISKIKGVLNVNMSSDFSEVLIVSTKEINLEELQKVISYDEKYKIKKINN